MRSAGGFPVLLLGLGAAVIAPAQTVTCIPAAVPAIVRAEGLTEKVGDIVLTCGYYK